MRPRDAVRSTARYHLRAFVPTAVGVSLAGVGLWYGLLSGDGTPLSPSAVAASERAVPASLLVGVGLLVVAFGRTAARITTTANLVAAEVESAQDDDGIDPDDIRETVALAVQHAVADTMDVASDRIESDVEAAVSRALEEVDGGSDDALTDETSAEDVLGDDTPADDTSADGVLADPLTATLPDGETEDGEASNPLADASRRASERMESLLDDDESEFPEETPQTPQTLSDGAEVPTDDEEASNLSDGVVPEDATTDGDENDGSDADAEMVFGTELKDAK